MLAVFSLVWAVDAQTRAEDASPAKLVVTALDESQLPVPGAQVEIKAEDQLILAATTDETGRAEFSCIPGRYTISAFKEGFEAALAADFEYRRGIAQTLEVMLKPAVSNAFMPIVCCSQSLRPAEALDRYLNSQRDQAPDCSGSVYAVQVDASLAALKKHGTMSGFKRIVKPGQTIYRGLRFTGDSLIKTQVIARFLAHETNPPEHAEDIAVTPRNYTFTFNRALDYNGLTAYVFLLKPRRKRTGLFRGELWLESATAVPLRIWGDLVKSPSIFVRSIRFVEDYQTVCGCTEALRLLLTARTRIAGTVEMTVWTHAVSQDPDAEDDLR